ncbi:UTRA domain-containing protein [Iocasia frigidifontis]|uniref:UTRA domain-containing protein n=1 Tax=Iocasia fonsfrigidae TaxID=2682810 RepID=A0A8A7KC94_9FIRM|nr:MULTISPECIES: GntR family transcriptional regulator [Halanaerobiaceae]AZO93635.1 GntR family transcriptional regulator [Halocella sp. SP3-1]QTL96507.1 UTRA domain-containing protein [Iocasia fonsfrigidae]
MKISINKNSHIPIYFQIQKQIRKAIEKVKIKPGEQLPTERELSSNLGVSRVTIRKAMRGLIMEGLCEKKSGKGIFVADKKLIMNIQNLEGTTQFIKRFGFDIKTSVIDKKIIKSEENLSSKLELVEGSDVLFLKRVRYVKGEPVMLEETYLPLYLFENIEIEDLNRSLYNVLNHKYNIKPARSKGVYNIRISGEKESEILNLKLNTPLLVKKATSYTSEEIPFEYNIAKYRTDKFEFIIDLKSN